MKRYVLINERGEEWIVDESRIDERDLGNLGERRVEVECRKPCRCSVCHRFINPGDKAFKTSQWLLAKQRYHRTTYCDRCYRPEVGQVVS